MKKTDVVVRSEYDRKPTIMLHYREQLEPIAALAASFCEKWGMVAAVSDGEDSAGRHRVRLATPDEVVDRAFAMAEGIWAKARATDQILDVPPYAEIEGRAEEDRKKN